MAEILIVDDEKPIRHMLKRLIERHGHHGVLAADVNEARARLEEQPFELVLCDVNMPGDSGLELTRTIGESYQDTATVMVTGVDDPSIAEAALVHGAYGYIIKPFELNEILINIDHVEHHGRGVPFREIAIASKPGNGDLGGRRYADHIRQIQQLLLQGLYF